MPISESLKEIMRGIARVERGELYELPVAGSRPIRDADGHVNSWIEPSGMLTVLLNTHRASCVLGDSGCTCGSTERAQVALDKYFENIT